MHGVPERSFVSGCRGERLVLGGHCVDDFREGWLVHRGYVHGARRCADRGMGRVRRASGAVTGRARPPGAFRHLEPARRRSGKGQRILNSEDSPGPQLNPRFRREGPGRCGRLVFVEFLEQGFRCRGDVVVVVLGCTALDGKNCAAVKPPEIPEGKAVASLCVV